MSWTRKSEIKKNQYQVRLTATKDQWQKRKSDIEKLGHTILKEGIADALFVLQEYGEEERKKFWAVVEIPREVAKK